MNALSNQQTALLGEWLGERERELKASIQAHMGRLRETAPPGVGLVAGDPADLADRADDDVLRDNEQNAVLRELRELHAIEAQRARIAGDRAGVCIDCGDQVGFERLRAQPSAARCVDCQDSYENARHAAPPASGEASAHGA